MFQQICQSPPFQNYFNKLEHLHQYNTRHTKQNLVILTQRNKIGIKSIQHQATTTWNNLQDEANHDILQGLRSKTKEFITNKMLNSY